MDFSWSEDQQLFRAEVVRFAQRELDPGADERDRSGTFSRELWRRAAEFGLLGLAVSTEYGGQGADPLTVMLALEALGYGSRDNGLTFSMNAHMWSCATPIQRFGSQEQKARYLPGLCDGSLIGVQGMTEPDSGSDAFGLSTTAEDRNGDYVLNGSKILITNAPVADLFVVFASTDPRSGAFGISAFIVERDAPGLTVGPAFEKMGLKTSPMSELHFDDCVVGESQRLGRPGNGMAIFNHSIDWERACILACAVGTMERQIEDSVNHARKRKQFGQPIADFQAVAHRIVDMKVRLEASRMLLYRAGWEKQEAGGDVTSMASAIAKLHISESWVQTSLDALQTLGGYGYVVESGAERNVRDAIAGRIYSGTSDIQRNIIAKELGL